MNSSVGLLLTEEYFTVSGCYGSDKYAYKLRSIFPVLCHRRRRGSDEGGGKNERRLERRRDEEEGERGVEEEGEVRRKRGEEEWRGWEGSEERR